jgi:mono/diheme cytochrome c family protein
MKTYRKALTLLSLPAAIAITIAAGLAYAQKGDTPAAASGIGTRSDPQPMVTVAPHALPAGAAAPANDAVSRGAYLARAGDCVACHTAPGGKPFAGGLAMPSPIGTIYTSNITPDAKTGIGGYSFEDFDKAVRHGVARDKGSLYPAMPYPSYARVSEQDMKDLFAYFQSLPPVEHAVQANDIPWPLSMRWPLSIWRALFAPDAAKVQLAQAPAISADNAPQADVKARGAYLVEGLGHCGTCHTPRSVTMQEKGLTAADAQFLAGGAPMDGWIAKSLRTGGADGLARWSEQDLVALLKTGRNPHTAVFGGMAEVVSHSTQHMTDGDLRAIAVYLKALPAGGSTASYAYNAAAAEALWKGNDSQRGAALYVDNCAACHRTDGKGYQEVFPALAGNSAVLSGDPHNLVAIILNGHQVPATATRPSTFTMPAFGWRLSDAQVADVASFVRASWGNQAGAVSAGQVTGVRKQLPQHNEQGKP